MAKKARKTKSTTVRVRSSRKELTPVMQLGVVFIIIAAMVLLMYAARLNP